MAILYVRSARQHPSLPIHLATRHDQPPPYCGLPAQGGGHTHGGVFSRDGPGLLGEGGGQVAVHADCATAPAHQDRVMPGIAPLALGAFSRAKRIPMLSKHADTERSDGITTPPTGSAAG